MSKKFWEGYSIKPKQEPVVSKKPATLIRELRAGRVDVSNMNTEELHTHMAGEAKLLSNIRSASGLPAIRPLQREYDNPVSTNPNEFKLVDTSTPVDATSVKRRKP